MLLTISTTHQPATDLGYLLHKNPARLQTEELSFGKAYVFYPDASVDRCTAALLVEIDPVALVRGREPAGEGGQLEQCVNDRPYAANSFLSVAMGRTFSTAMSKIAPAWGQFYEVSGDLMDDVPSLEWKLLGHPARSTSKHFLFYLRDETFECDASDFNLSFESAI
jgi:hypothetical protein